MGDKVENLNETGVINIQTPPAINEIDAPGDDSDKQPEMVEVRSMRNGVVHIEMVPAPEGAELAMKRDRGETVAVEETPTVVRSIQKGLVVESGTVVENLSVTLPEKVEPELPEQVYPEEKFAPEELPEETDAAIEEAEEEEDTDSDFDFD